MTPEQIVKDALEAYARIQKSITLAEETLPSLETPTDEDDWGLRRQRANIKAVQGYLVDAAFDNTAMRDAVIRLDTALRGMTAAYHEAYRSMPLVYAQGEQEGRRRTQPDLSDYARETLQLLIIVLAAMEVPDCDAFCGRIRQMIEQPSSER
jgi:hypothetical protein